MPSKADKKAGHDNDKVTHISTRAIITKITILLAVSRIAD